jgi:hypothetical protein
MTERKDDDEVMPEAAKIPQVQQPSGTGGAHGISSGLQPSGTLPGGGPGAGLGSLGTGGASTGGAPTGSVKRGGR